LRLKSNLGCSGNSIPITPFPTIAQSTAIKIANRLRTFIRIPFNSFAE
jgi:hypothetical protein